ncbi:hypothetical protein [Natrinema sp. CBA1119]|uniref:hypothetical protein n=1 Tax=Natrinema sp. CBA1119 TaxID=1608465 RepID=UPI0011454A9B|nr:hypothetical protein [Natrinema sp. CBA1119]
MNRRGLDEWAIVLAISGTVAFTGLLILSATINPTTAISQGEPLYRLQSSLLRRIDVTYPLLAKGGIVMVLVILGTLVARIGSQGR